MCLKTYHSYSTNFFSALGLAWQAALEKTEVKLQLFINIDLVRMFIKGITGEVCQTID